MARGVQIPDEIRAQVIAELLTGAAVNATARKYQLSPATVSRIRSDVAPDRLKQVETEKREGIADLLLIMVASNVRNMKRISDAVSEPNHIKTQSLSSVAEIYRAMSDTTLSILEAASLAGLEGPGDEPANE